MSAREKDTNWTLTKNDNGNYSYAAAQLAVLMDLRDELKKLNTVMQCPNVAAGFRAMQRLNEIARRDDKNFKRRVRRAVNRKLRGK